MVGFCELLRPLLDENVFVNKTEICMKLQHWYLVLVIYETAALILSLVSPSYLWNCRLIQTILSLVIWYIWNCSSDETVAVILNPSYMMKLQQQWYLVLVLWWNWISAYLYNEIRIKLQQWSLSNMSWIRTIIYSLFSMIYKWDYKWDCWGIYLQKDSVNKTNLLV